MKHKLTDKEIFHLLIEKTISVIISMMDAEAPTDGEVKPLYVNFDIPSTNNMGYMFVLPSEEGIPERRCLRISSCRKGSDKLHSYYLVSDTKEKIKEYLKADGIVKSLINDFQTLSDRVDDD